MLHTVRSTCSWLTTAAAVLLLAAPAAAQRPEAVHRLGLLLPGSSGTATTRVLVDAFRNGLRELGWIEGRNVSIEYRFAEGKQDLLPELAAELVRLRVELIVVEGTPAIGAAKNATATIPIVMTTVSDPVRLGFIASFARPGGNVTGLTLLNEELNAKRIELLKELMPGVSRVAVVWNAANPGSARSVEQTRSAARSLDIQLHAVEVRAPDELDGAFAAVARAGSTALLTISDGMFHNQRARIVGLAARSRLPAFFPEPEFVEAGGLIAYGPSVPANFRRAASYVDRILRGAKPGELPVEQPAKFELVINLRTAKTLGLTIPPSLLLRADRVIE